MSKRVLSGVTHIYFTPWGESAPESGSGAQVELTGIIGDTVSITQDDPETSDIECETTDEPLYTTTKLGKYSVSMDSGDIQQDILVKCLGFVAPTGLSDVAHAPASYTAKYALIEVVMNDTKFVLPRVQLNSKIDASSLKTGVAKGTIGGTANSAKMTITPTSGSAVNFTAPFFVCGASQTVTYALPD